HADAAAARESVALLAAELQPPGERALGAARGLHFLARQPAARAEVAAALPTLKQVLGAVRGSPDMLRRKRRLLVASAVAAGGHDAAVLDSALRDDSDPGLRREAAAGLNSLADTAAARLLLHDALRDDAGTVRLEGVRTYARRFAARDGCSPLVNATRDS